MPLSTQPGVTALTRIPGHRSGSLPVIAAWLGTYTAIVYAMAAVAATAAILAASPQRSGGPSARDQVMELGPVW